jgi:hypothetical protein
MSSRFSRTNRCLLDTNSFCGLLVPKGMGRVRSGS